MNLYDEIKVYMSEKNETMMEHQIPPKSLRYIKALLDRCKVLEKKEETISKIASERYGKWRESQCRINELEIQVTDRGNSYEQAVKEIAVLQEKGQYFHDFCNEIGIPNGVMPYRVDWLRNKITGLEAEVERLTVELGQQKIKAYEFGIKEAAEGCAKLVETSTRAMRENIAHDIRDKYLNNKE